MGKKNYHTFTPEETRFLEKNHSGRSYAELAALFNERFGCSLTVNGISMAIFRYGIRNAFGHGRRQVGARFAPGNHRPVGYEFISKGAVVIKVAEPDVWRRKSAVVWEKANKRPVPAGHVVVCADGNKLNLRPKNLLLVSKRALALMNRDRAVCADRNLTLAGKLIADIRLLICDRKRAGRGGRPPAKPRAGSP
jgi:hypothetical protein